MSESGKQSQFIEYTKCPKCGTLFDVSDIDFSDSQGWVQCGDCTEQFDAAKHSVNYSALLEQSILANMDGMNTVQSNFSVGGLNIESTQQVDSITSSHDADVLDGAIIVEQTHKTDEVDLEDDDFVISKEDFISESNAKADPSIEVIAQETSFDSEQYTLTKSRFSAEDEPPKPHIGSRIGAENTVDLRKPANEHDIDIEPGLYRELNGESKSVWSSLLLYALAIPLVLGLGLILLLQLQNRGLIDWIPSSVVEKIETKAPFLVNNEGQARVTDLSKINLTATRMERHPTKKGYVNVVLQLSNKGDSAQLYPALEISFTDAVGKTVARKIFGSDEYLSPNSSTTLKSRESKSITLTFDKLPKGSVGYEIRVIKSK